MLEAVLLADILFAWNYYLSSFGRFSFLLFPIIFEPCDHVSLSTLNRVNITIANDEFIHFKHKLCSDQHTEAQALPLLPHTRGAQHDNICRVKHTHPVLCTRASQKLLIHLCASPALHSFIIIYFHQLKTRKTHFRPLIMQTREPLCHTRTVHPELVSNAHIVRNSLAAKAVWKINMSNVLAFCMNNGYPHTSLCCIVSQKSHMKYT